MFCKDAKLTDGAVSGESRQDEHSTAHQVSAEHPIVVLQHSAELASVAEIASPAQKLTAMKNWREWSLLVTQCRHARKDMSKSKQELANSFADDAESRNRRLETALAKAEHQVHDIISMCTNGCDYQRSSKAKEMPQKAFDIFQRDDAVAQHVQSMCVASLAAIMRVRGGRELSTVH